MSNYKRKCSICGKVIRRPSAAYTTPCYSTLCGFVFCEICESLRNDLWRKLFRRWFKGQKHSRLPTIPEWSQFQQAFEASLKIEATQSLQPAQSATVDDESELPLNYKEKGYTRKRIPEAELVFFQRGKPELEEPKVSEPPPVEPEPEPAQPPAESQPIESKSAEAPPVEPESAEPLPVAPINHLEDWEVQKKVALRVAGKIGPARSRACASA